MKKLLLIATLLISVGVQAQGKGNSDTLEVKDYHRFKYIKLGDRVYKIESPTLTEVPDNALRWSLTPGYIQAIDFSSSTGGITIDTLSSKIITKSPKRKRK